MGDLVVQSFEIISLERLAKVIRKFDVTHICHSSRLRKGNSGILVHDPRCPFTTTALHSVLPSSHIFTSQSSKISIINVHPYLKLIAFCEGMQVTVLHRPAQLSLLKGLQERAYVSLQDPQSQLDLASNHPL